MRQCVPVLSLGRCGAVRACRWPILLQTPSPPNLHHLDVNTGRQVALSKRAERLTRLGVCLATCDSFFSRRFGFFSFFCGKPRTGTKKQGEVHHGDVAAVGSRSSSSSSEYVARVGKFRETRISPSPRIPAVDWRERGNGPCALFLWDLFLLATPDLFEKGQTKKKPSPQDGTYR